MREPTRSSGSSRPATCSKGRYHDGVPGAFRAGGTALWEGVQRVPSSRSPDAAAHGNLVPSAGESTRKAELAKLLLEYSAAHGLSGMSLRPLAVAVGSSPRMLLYFFGSKEGLIREVLAMSRERQMTMVEQWLTGDGPGGDPLARLWQWLADPAQADVERLFFESYGRSLIEQDGGPWESFGADSVADWLPLVARMLGQAAGREAAGTAAATLVLAALRGLLLDQLATGDTQRVTAAFRLLAPGLSAIRGAGEEGDAGQ